MSDLLRLAFAALGAGDANRALALTDAVLARDPGHADALQLQAGAALHLGQHQRAADCLDRASRLRPGVPTIPFNQGVLELQRGRPAHAVLAFKRCLRLQPGNIDAKHGLAQALAQSGQDADAAELCRNLLDVRPTDLIALEGRARALHRMGQDALALAEVEAVVTRLADSTPVWLLLARVQEELGDRVAAEATLDHGLQAGANPVAIAMAQGHLAYRHGQYDRAAEAFRRASDQQPDLAGAWNNLAACLSRLDQVEDAIHAARQATGLQPDAPLHWGTLAAALSRSTDREQLEQAASVGERLLAETPGQAQVHDCLAVVLGKLGRHKEALVHAETAVELDPAHPDHALTLARQRQYLGQLDEAEDALRQLLTTATPPASVLAMQGHLNLRQGKPEQALRALDAAWQLLPDSQQVIAERGVALAVVEGWRKAAQWLDTESVIQPVPIQVPPGFENQADFLRALASDIRNHSRMRYEPIGLVARGGSLTGDLLADRTPAIMGFAASLTSTIETYIAGLLDRPDHPFLGRIPRGARRMHVWATCVSRQGAIDTHIHDGSWLSGAYYVVLPKALSADDSAGWIEFGKPPSILPQPPESELVRIQPIAGQMLFFPSYLYHRTLPFDAEGDRISISFDLGPA